MSISDVLDQIQDDASYVQDAFSDVLRVIVRHRDHELVVVLGLLTVVAYLGLRRSRDPLFHRSLSCYHAPTCFYHDEHEPDDDDDEDEKRRIVVMPSPTGVAAAVSIEDSKPRCKSRPRLRPWHMRRFMQLPLELRIVGSIIAGIGSFVTVLPLLFASVWSIRQAAIGRQKCRCAHRPSCRLAEKNWRPAAGFEGGIYDPRGGTPGHTGPDGRGWRAAIRLRPGPSTR